MPLFDLHKPEFSPKRWNIFCWATLIIWSYLSVAGNIPFEPEYVAPSEIELPDGAAAMAYDHSYLIGCPFTYLEILTAQSGKTSKTYRWPILGINLVLICITLFSIVYSVQTLAPKFSIKSVLVVTACIAMLFPLGSLISSTDNYFLLFGFIYSIYFAPVAAVLPAVVKSKFESEEN